MRPVFPKINMRHEAPLERPTLPQFQGFVGPSRVDMTQRALRPQSGGEPLEVNCPRSLECLLMDLCWLNNKMN